MKYFIQMNKESTQKNLQLSSSRSSAFGQTRQTNHAQNTPPRPKMGVEATILRRETRFSVSQTKSSKEHTHNWDQERNNQTQSQHTATNKQKHARQAVEFYENKTQAKKSANEGSTKWR